VRVRRAVIFVLPRLVGLLFLLAAAGKLHDPSEIHAVLRFDLIQLTGQIRESVVERLTTLIVTAETAIGLALLLGLARTLTGVAALSILMLFTAQLAYLLAFDHAPDCGCLSMLASYESARQSHIAGLIRNAILLAAMYWYLRATHTENRHHAASSQ
jgi:uncharacterized membrane protein YphA (DoxX/SURF4 family)